jgi:hypothetical protein
LNRKKRQDWWAKNHKVFWISGEPGGATFIPGNPASPRTLKSVPQILAQLDKALEDADPEVRAAAVEGYAKIGPKAKTTLEDVADGTPRKRKSLRNKDLCHAGQQTSGEGGTLGSRSFPVTIIKRFDAKNP